MQWRGRRRKTARNAHRHPFRQRRSAFQDHHAILYSTRNNHTAIVGGKRARIKSMHTRHDLGFAPVGR